MNAKELREAAATLAGKTVDNLEVYNEDAPNTGLFSREAVQAGIVLANHYASEHAADDDEDIDEKWFRSIADIVNISGPTVILMGDSRAYITWFDWGVGYYDDDAEGVSKLNVKKRGQFRKLCRALGVELKEVK